MKTKIVDKRLHSSIIYINGIKRIISIIVICFVYTLFRENYLEQMNLSMYIFFSIGFAAMLLRNYLTWFHFRYSIDQNHFIVSEGVFLKKTKHIPIERINNIEVQQQFWHRVFNTVSLRIETASNEDNQILKIKSVSRAEAVKLKLALGFEHQETQLPIWAMPTSYNILFSLSSLRIAIVFSIVSFMYFQLDILKKLSLYHAWQMWLLTLPIEQKVIAIGCLLAVLSWVVSFVITIFKYSAFQVSVDEQHIQITKGLIQKQKHSIHLNSIVGIRIVEPPYLQCFGFCTVRLDCIGQGEEDSKPTILFPIIKRSQVNAMLGQLLPPGLIQLDDDQLDEHDIGKSFFINKRGMLELYMYRLIVVTAVCSIVLWQAKEFSALLLLLALLIPFTYMQCKDSVIQLQKNVIKLSYRKLSKTTIYLSNPLIDQFVISSAPLQRRLKTISITFSIKVYSMSKSYVMSGYDEAIEKELITYFNELNE